MSVVRSGYLMSMFSCSQSERLIKFLRGEHFAASIASCPLLIFCHVAAGIERFIVVNEVFGFTNW
jgi:hypothetical protein